MKGVLAPLFSAIPSWAPAAPPAWQVEPAADAHAVEVARRFVFLRLGPEGLPPPVVTLLVLGGAVALGFVDGRLEVLGPALAGWSRAVRARAFWQAFVPDPDAVAELVGHAPGAG